MSKNENQTILEIPLKNIVQKENSRGDIADSEIKDLMVSMKHNGLLQPIGVSDLGAGLYEVVFGNRRLTAAKKLGWKTVDSIVIGLEEGKEANDLLIKNAVENLQRKNPPVFQQGRMFAELQKNGMTVGEIAARTGLPEVRVREFLRTYTSQIGKKYKGRIVSYASPRKNARKEGAIALTTVSRITTLGKSHRLSATQVGQLLDSSSKHGYGQAKVAAIAKLMKYNGMTVAQALKSADDYTTFSVFFTMKVSDVKRLERECGKSIRQLIYDTVSKKYPLTFSDRKTDSDQRLVTLKGKVIERGATA